MPDPAETSLEITGNPPTTPSTPSGGNPSQSLTKSRSERETSNPAPSPSPTAPRTSREDLPFGELVAGKTGFVYSPYSKKELVDVSGIPTGTKVKCPYSGKTFRVP